jgi:hypothetical protein
VNQSIEINLLNEALAKAQGSFPPIAKNKTAKVFSKRTNSEFSYQYADLSDVLSGALPKLSENGLSLRQPLRDTPKGMRLVTELHHLSGQWASDDGLPLSSGLTPQEFGIEHSYMRRYGACAMLGIAPGVNEEADLDKNTRNREKQYKAAAGRNERAMGATSPEASLPITKEQTSSLQEALKKNGKKAAALYEYLELKMGTPIPASRLQEALVWVGSAVPAEMPSKVMDAFNILAWTEFERHTFIDKHENRWEEILKSLNNMIDAENIEA